MNINTIALQLTDAIANNDLVNIYELGALLGGILQQNGNSAAFPIEMEEQILQGRQISPSIKCFGLTKFEWFAAHAPEAIPEWFSMDYSGFPEIEYPKIIEELSDEDRAIMYEYEDNQCDLPPHLNLCGVAIECYWKEKGERERKIKESRFFQWRAYYANKMCSL